MNPYCHLFLYLLYCKYRALPCPSFEKGDLNGLIISVTNSYCLQIF
nr:MAG TPA: hypothetical protein [Caudoviricetes sp.]